jgi:hypothetical protein
MIIKMTIIFAIKTTTQNEKVGQFSPPDFRHKLLTIVMENHQAYLYQELCSHKEHCQRSLMSLAPAYQF